MAKDSEKFENSSLDKLYGEPITVNIAGFEYKMDRIKVRDISAVYARIRDNRIKAVLRNHKDTTAYIAAQSIAHAAAIDPTQEDYWNYACTPAGMVYILWRCLSPHHPRITEADVELLIEKEGGLKDLLLAESGITQPDGAEDPDAEGENRDPPPVFGQSSPKQTGPKGQAG